MLPWKCGAILSLVSGIELRLLLLAIISVISGFRELCLHLTGMKTDPRAVELGGHVL